MCFWIAWVFIALDYCIRRGGHITLLTLLIIFYEGHTYFCTADSNFATESQSGQFLKNCT